MNTQNNKPSFKQAKKASEKPFAEVIESSLHGFVAQSWTWDTFPAFGSLVTIADTQRTIFGIVYQVQTGSIDPGRQPFAYKKTHEELRQEQPQLFEMLKTTFSCVTCGYQKQNLSHQQKAHSTLQYLIAPEPPLIHSFITRASAEEHKQFFARHTYLHLLFGTASTIGNLDELLLALLSHQAQHAMLTHEHVTTFIETFSLLTGNDYRRLKLFLQRVEPLVSL